jgi:fructose-bisphosphate aldolase class II
LALAGIVPLLAEARDRRYSVLAFNVILLEYAEAIVAAAEAAGAPVILQISQNAVRYHGDRIEPLGLACLELARNAAIPVALHLDHATTRELCDRAAAIGFGSIMYDASALPEAVNIEQTAEVVRWAHRLGLAVEAEIGIVGGKDGRHEVLAPTAPDDAERFARLTGVDALAVQAGTSHAMVTRTAALDRGLIARLRESVPLPLVLHGSSGVPDEQLVAAARAGIAKINIGTRLNLAFSSAVRARLREDAAIVDPRIYLGSGRTGVRDAAASLIERLTVNLRG